MDDILTLQRIKVNRENRLACNYKTVEQSLTGFASQGLSAPPLQRKGNLLECGYIRSHSVSWLTPCDARKFIQKHLHPQVQRVNF